MKKLTLQDGARFKIWPGAIGNSTNTGGGSGWVRNVTYNGMHNYNNDWTIEMTVNTTLSPTLAYVSE
ncbi:hypothetical protein CNMCM5623_009673 [Aspergillus felis]|uniref:Uncharacterized protein n=1 Tax=Aspergillus felis TaxID=1287682 RepID=A0A8H6UKE1_9EURO|nr:hypothetical protein CNMCM5623_009673 [Aspergillus felis]KAF7181818.1 hypothetical protein CNMCM7691_001115 [Aspergillus felis]